MRPPLAWLTRSPRRGGLSTARGSLSVVRAWEVVAFLLWSSPQVGCSPPNIFQSVHGLHQDPAGGALFLQLRGNAPSVPNICGFSVHLLRSVSVRRCGGCVGAFPLVSDYMRTPLLALGASVNILKIIRLTLSGWGRRMPEQEGKRRAKHGQQTEENGRKLETRRQQEQKSIKRAAKLVRLNGCLCIFC